MSPGTRAHTSACMTELWINSADRAYEYPCSMLAYVCKTPCANRLPDILPGLNIFLRIQRLTTCRFHGLWDWWHLLVNLLPQKQNDSEHDNHTD